MADKIFCFFKFFQGARNSVVRLGFELFVTVNFFIRFKIIGTRKFLSTQIEFNTSQLDKFPDTFASVPTRRREWKRWRTKEP